MKPSVQKIVAKLAKEQEKKVEKVELALLQDILSSVSANGEGASKARAAIRNAFKELGQAFEAYERIAKRTERMKQDTKEFQTQMRTLGIDKSNLDTQGRFVVDGTYVEMAEKLAINLKHVRDALGAIRQTGEV